MSNMFLEFCSEADFSAFFAFFDPPGLPRNGFNQVEERFSGHSEIAFISSSTSSPIDLLIFKPFQLGDSSRNLFRIPRFRGVLFRKQGMIIYPPSHMKTIAIDIRLIGKGRTGDEMVFRSLTEGILAFDKENRYLLLTDETEGESSPFFIRS